MRNYYQSPVSTDSMFRQVRGLTLREGALATGFVLGVNLLGISLFVLWRQGPNRRDVRVAFAAFDRVSRVAAALLVPYLAWVSFALVLNYAIYAG